ncbi:CAP-associated domain-containing protein [Enterococcus sp. LJL98]
MGRRSILFSGLFILSLVVVYLQPVFSYRATPAPVQGTHLQTPPLTSLNVEPLPTQGLAQWVGQPMKAFEGLYGQAMEVTDSGFGFQNHRYAVKSGSLMEVTTMENRVTSIKVLGDGEFDISPFHYNQNLDELMQQTTISPIVSFDYHGETYRLELMEDDMNYRPLVAFDNDTYAILFFNHHKKENALYSLMYLDQETLLKLAPYILISGNPIFFEEKETANWASINIQKSEKSRAALAVLRQMDDLPPYESQMKLQQETEERLSDFLQNSEDYLSTERLQSFRRIQQKAMNQNWVLNNKEIQTLIGEETTNLTFAHFEMPVYDPILTVLSWSSNPYLVSHLFNEDSEALGIAFSKENMLVLFQALENMTESSEAP